MTTFISISILLVVLVVFLVLGFYKYFDDIRKQRREPGSTFKQQTTKEDARQDAPRPIKINVFRIWKFGRRKVHNYFTYGYFIHKEWWGEGMNETRKAIPVVESRFLSVRQPFRAQDVRSWF
jgi:hypothetical protein